MTTTILIVDDEPVNIALLSNLLKPNYQVRAATSGRQALHAARMQQQPLGPPQDSSPPHQFPCNGTQHGTELGAWKRHSGNNLRHLEAAKRGWFRQQILQAYPLQCGASAGPPCHASRSVR